MFNITKKSINWGGKELSIETGKVARQADGAVMVRYGGTTVLCAVTAKKEPMPGVDFFPLTVMYQEKYYAAGKIPGGFFKREARPTEKETLLSRLIDRPIRPLFDEWFLNETQVVCTVLEHDGKNDSDVPAMISASAALAISGVPFNGPIAGANVGFVNGEYVLNPEMGENAENKLELSVAGTKSSVMMVESEAKEISEAEMLGAVKFAHDSMQPVIEMIEELAKEVGKPRWEVKKPDTEELEATIKKVAEDDLRTAFSIKEKQQRSEKIAEANAKVIEAVTATLPEGEELDKLLVNKLFKKLEMEIVRGDLIKTSTRIDGRKPDQVRQIEAEVGFLPATHGSALFTRGETQAIVVTTLGTGQDEQMIDGLEPTRTQNFMLHYNFPPYSVGEVGRMTGPGRREIGHGKLAWRAVKPLLPSKDDFPYTMRVVSEITESNGSSSMATVCGTSMALMDAGVPVPRPISGIAMGLIMEGDDYVVLSDIMGDEDHLGDMDFKVAGTEAGVTSLQMDIKIQGITIEIMQKALDQANSGRAHILGEMAKAISQARPEVGGNAPKFKKMTIPTNKIREVIGAGGKVIKNIVEVSGAKVDINDDGTIKIAGTDNDGINKAVEMIEEITFIPEVGDVYDTKVMKIMDFGAIVQFKGKSQGLIHISELAEQKPEKVEDFVKTGQSIKAKVIGVDKQGKIKLSSKQVDGSSSNENNEDENIVEIETPEEITSIN